MPPERLDLIPTHPAGWDIHPAGWDKYPAGWEVRPAGWTCTLLGGRRALPGLGARGGALHQARLDRVQGLCDTYRLM